MSTEQRKTGIKGNKARLGYVWVASLLLIGHANAEPEAELVARSSVDRSTITVGDRIHYRIELSYPESTEIQAPGFGVHLGEFEVKDYNLAEPKKGKDGRMHAVYEYVISTFTTGQYAIPSVAIAYRIPGGVPSQIWTDKIDIMVESVKPSESGDIQDIKEPVEIKGGLDWWFYALIGLVAVGGIVSGLHYWSRRRKELRKAKPAKPPYEAAIEELEILLGSGLLESGRFREFHFRLSEIIRKYLGVRYDFNAPDLTSDELIEKLPGIGFENDLLTGSVEFLRKTDLVKFADHQPADEESKLVIENAKQILEMTKPRPPVTVNPEPAEGERKADAAISRS